MIRNILLGFVTLSVAIPVVIGFVVAPWPLAVKAGTAIWLLCFGAAACWLETRS